MAAIVPIAFDGAYKVIRDASAQANVGQTDWINVPTWALWMEAIINITAVAGTTPIFTPTFYAGATATRDDGDKVAVHAPFTTPPTAAGTHRVLIGPGVTPSDDLAMAASGDSQCAVNVPLPALMGVESLLDRGTGDETYTYSVSIRFGR